MYSSTDASTARVSHCQHCGNYHTGQCPRVKAIEYYANGTMKRIEFFETTHMHSGLWQTQPSPYLPPYEITSSAISVIPSNSIRVMG